MLLFADGFDHYNSLPEKWTTSNGAAISSAVGRNGNGCDISFGAISKTLVPRSSLVVGFALQLATSGVWGGVLYSLNAVSTSSSTASLLALRVEPDATLSLFAGTSGALITNTAGTFAFMSGVWYYIEMKFELNGSAPIVCTAELRVNGVVVGSGAGNTTFNSNALLLQVAKGNYHVFNGMNQTSTHTWIDDLYINDQTGVVGGGSFANDYRGDVVVGPGIFPISDVIVGLSSTGGNGWSQIDDHPPDGDATYVFGSTAGVYSNYLFNPVTSLIGEIQAAQLCMFMRKDNEGQRVVAPVVGNDLYEGPQISLSDSYFFYTFPMDVDPSSGNPFTPSLLNALAFGVKVIS